MNKTKRTLFLIVLLFTFLLSSCSNFMGKDKGAVESETVFSNVEKGTAHFKILVPEYYNCENTTDSRAISPQTVKIQFRYKRDGLWSEHTVINLADVESEPLTTEIGLTGKLYNLNFKGIPVGTYKAGEMEIQLLDRRSDPLSKGTNKNEAIIKVSEEGSEEKTVVYFYTIPVDTANQNGSLKKGEMKFWKVNARAYCNYTLRVLALSEPEFLEENRTDVFEYHAETYPKIVLFNEDGTFNSSYSTNKNDELITIEKANTDRTFYVGVYAQDADVYCYSLSFAADNGKRSIWEQGFDYEDFKQEWNIVSNAGQTPVFTNEKSELIGADSVISYTFKGLEDGVQIVSRTLILDEKTTLNYTTIGGICTCTDGYFCFEYHKYDSTTPSSQNYRRWSYYEDDYSITLSPGKYTVTWIVYGLGPDEGNYHNIWYLYNLQCTNNRSTTKIEFTDNYSLETCVYNSIQLKASALDSYNRENPSEEIKWEVVEGSGTISQTGLFTPGEIAETCVIKATATSCNKSATVSIKVNPASDKSSPYTIGNKTYKGLVSSTGERYRTETGFTLNSIEGVPTCMTNEADGFFTLSGTLDAGNSIAVYVSTVVNGIERYNTYTFTEGCFNERIWLRYGAGDYKVNIMHTAPVGNTSGYFYNSYITFNVKNIADISCDEARMLFPSAICPSDNYIIQNAVKESIKDLPSDASDTEKLRAIHDWIAARTTYDYESASSIEKRKSQEAIDVVKNRLAVCEGYANLFIAMARAVGVKTKYIYSEPMNHAWAQVLIDGEWKLVDVTWDAAKDYSYFLIGLNGIDGDHNGWVDYFSTEYANQRSITTTEYIDR